MKSHLALGSLSAVVGHPINGYLPMPDWVGVQPDGSAREPPKEEPRSLAGTSGAQIGNRTGDEGNNEFYSGSSSGSSSSSSPEGSSGSGSESGEDESSPGSVSNSESSSGSSVSGSESESESADDDDSASSVGSRSRSSSESSSGDSETSASEGEEGVGLLIMGPGATSAAATYGASAPAPSSQDLTSLVERMSVVDREDSASPQLDIQPDGLTSLSMAGVHGPGLLEGGNGPVDSTQGVVAATSVAGRSGLLAVGQSVRPGADTSLSFPSTLLRHQAGGGLQVDYRYTRGKTSSISRPTTTLTLRLTLSNHRETPIRRIRAVAPRDGTPMNLFPEVQSLAAGTSVETNLGLDFGGRAKEVSAAGKNCFSPDERYCCARAALHGLLCLVG